MKDFFKKISDKVNVAEPAATMGNIVRVAAHALPESKPSQMALHTISQPENRILIGFFKVNSLQWAPYYIDESEYQAHAMLNNAHRPRRMRPNQHHTMSHPFMYGCSVYLLEAYVENNLAELKRTSQEYRTGAAKFDFSTGAPRLATAAAVAPVQETKIAPPAPAPSVQAAAAPVAPLPLAVAPQPQAQLTTVTAPETVTTSVINEAPITLTAPTLASQPEVVVEETSFAKPSAFVAVTPTVTTSLAALMPELSAQHHTPAAPVSAPLTTVQSDFLEVADSANDVLHELHHMATSSGIIQYAQQAK